MSFSFRILVYFSSLRRHSSFYLFPINEANACCLWHFKSWCSYWFFDRWMWWRMPTTKDWNAIMGMMRVEMMMFPQRMLDTISISWPIRCHIFFIFVLFCWSYQSHLMSWLAVSTFKIWSFHLFSTCVPCSESREEKAPRMPAGTPRAVDRAGPQENSTWYQKLGQQGGENPMSEPKE